MGDPHNSIRVFSDKEVDELILFDIEATKLKKKPNISFIEKVAEECYMPFSIGGGIDSIETIREILRAGAEKVIVNTAALLNPSLIKLASEEFGRTSIVVSIDYKKTIFGNCVIYSHCGTKPTRFNLIEYSKLMEENGAGEIILTSMNRESTGRGLDTEIINKISKILSIPVVASGGIGSVDHILQAKEEGNFAAVGIGSYFLLNGSNRSPLIKYNREWEL